MYLSTEQLQYTHFSQPLQSPKVCSILEKGSGDINEDVLLQEDKIFGVFDGATSLDASRFNDGQTGGLLAARTAAQSFMADDCALNELAQRANHRIAQMQLSYNDGLQDRHRLWSTSCAVVRLTGDRLEYCQTGDALIVVIYKNGAYKVVTPEVDVDGNTLQLWKEMVVSSDMKIQDVLADQILKVRLEMNVRYGVLNGEPEALDFINHGYEDLTDVSDILLFTDGLHIPRENPLEDHDWQLFVETYRRGGLQAVRDYVRQQQQQDTACWRYPRFKLHDDIAALSISY